MRWFQIPFAIVVAGALASASCRSATEITLTIRTNLPCEEVEAWQGVAVYVGKPGAEAAEQAPTLVTKRCEAEGQIGSLVVVPSGARDELVGVRVVAGIDESPEECLAKSYEGCIVARRAIRFTPHTDLALEVELSSTCKNIACDPRSTCFPGGCQPALEAPAPVVEAPAPGTPSVRCGDDGVFCPTSGEVCCLTVDVEAKATHGQCMPASRCTAIVLHCDDDTDCPDDGATPGVCALGYAAMSDLPYIPVAISHSHCLLATSYGPGGLQRPHGLALCEETLPCANEGFRCFPTEDSSTLLPGYHWCQLDLPQ